ncbi:hypothetical protein HaLaN_08939, partial [Haematococcus lacustris]
MCPNHRPWPLGEDVIAVSLVVVSMSDLLLRSRLSLAYHSATWPPPTQLNPPSPNLVYPAQLPVAPPPSSTACHQPPPPYLSFSSRPPPYLSFTHLPPTSPSPISVSFHPHHPGPLSQARSQAAACRAQATNRDLQAEVQRLRDVEQSLMCTVDGLQGDLDDLQARTNACRMSMRLCSRWHPERQLPITPYGLLDAASKGKCISTAPHHSPLTCKQRQQLLILEQHPVSVEVLRRCAEAGYGRLNSHGRPMGSMAEQLSPAGLAPSPTDIFIPTQEGPVGRPAARTAPYDAHHCLSTVRLHLETGVSRRALFKCRQYFVSERCFLPNPHRPGKTSTVGQPHVQVIMEELLLHGLDSACIASITTDSAAVNMGEYGGVVARMSELLESKGQAGCIWAQPCYSHGTHNTLLTGLAALGGDIRLAIESIARLLTQYWVPLDMGARGAMPQVPCDTHWASYITSTVSMLHVWAHAGDAVSQMLERQKGRSPPWAVTLSQLLQDNSLLLRLSVVAVVGESFLVPELMWASKDDGLLSSTATPRMGQLQDAQMALPHLFAALGRSDPTMRMEVAVDVVYHAEQRMGQLRAEVLRKEDAAAAAQRSAKAEPCVPLTTVWRSVLVRHASHGASA